MSESLHQPRGVDDITADSRIVIAPAGRVQQREVIGGHENGDALRLRPPVDVQRAGRQHAAQQGIQLLRRLRGHHQLEVYLIPPLQHLPPFLLRRHAGREHVVAQRGRTLLYPAHQQGHHPFLVRPADSLHSLVHTVRPAVHPPPHLRRTRRSTDWPEQLTEQVIKIKCKVNRDYIIHHLLCQETPKKGHRLQPHILPCGKFMHRPPVIVCHNPQRPRGFCGKILPVLQFFLQPLPERLSASTFRCPCRHLRAIAHKQVSHIMQCPFSICLFHKKVFIKADAANSHAHRLNKCPKLLKKNEPSKRINPFSLYLRFPHPAGTSSCGLCGKS